MNNFVSLNFANIIAPTAGGQTAAGTGGAGLLSGTPLGGSGLLGGGAAQPGVDLFTLLLGQGKTPQVGENFAAAGKNLPQVPVSKEEINTTDKAIDALQSVLTGLVMQQQQPVQPAVSVAGGAAVDPVQAEQVLAGGAADQTLVGGASALSAAVYTASDNLQEAVGQSPLQPVTSPVVMNKTLDAYRSAAALTLLEAGAHLNTVDQKAIQAVTALSELPTAESVLPSNQKNSAGLSLLQSAEKSPDTLVESISRLKNLSAITPLPAEQGKQKTGAAGEGNNPLEQIAKLQSALAPVRPESVVSVKQEVAANKVVDASANGASDVVQTIAPNAVAQAATGQKLEQQLGQKKQKDSVIELAAPKQEVVDSALQQQTQPVVQRPEVAKVAGHEFISHLNRAAVPSPAEQVAMQIAKLPSGKQNITVQLDPADLGKVDVKLEWSPEGKTQISISAERRETLEMLKSEAGALQRSLSDSGIKADAGSLQFSMKGQENFAGQLAGESRDQKHSGTQPALNDTEIKQAVESASIAARYVNLNNLLDLRV